MTEKELVLPADLIPATVEAGLAPPTLATAKEIYTKAVDLAKSGMLSLKCAASLQISTPDDYKDGLDLVKSLRGMQKRLDECRKEDTDPARLWATNVKAMYDEACSIYEKAAKHAEDITTVWYLSEQERIRKEKAELQRRMEAERRKAEAEAAERRAAEEKRQAQEAEEINRKKEEAATQAKEAGDLFTVDVQAEAAAEEERQRIEQERAARAEADRKAEEERQAELERQERETAAATATLTFTKPKGIAMRWTYEIDNPDKVHRQYCDPTPAKLKAAVGSGLREKDADGNPNPMAAGLRIFQVPVNTGKGGGAR
jgi:murein DD-endopeptidase MepM/ murein hydrolase activator NlpD